MSRWARIAGDRVGVGPSNKFLASKSNSGLGRTDGDGLARAVSVYGCRGDLREPEAPGRASDGATTATDVWMDGWIYSTLPSARTPKIRVLENKLELERECRV